MKISDLIAEITAGVTVGERTCDTVKCGSVERDVTSIGVTMAPTLAVLRAAARENIEFLIVHEPLYYDHMDKDYNPNDPVIAAKQAVLAESEMTVFRFHDYPHAMCPDLILEGALAAVSLSGTLRGTELFLTADIPMTARELADRFAATGLSHVRMIGNVDTPMTRFVVSMGAPGSGIVKYLTDPQAECICVGEISEWKYGEYVRDAVEAGQNKAMLILGHAGSEEYGMRLFAERLAAEYPELSVTYLPCGELYQN